MKGTRWTVFALLKAKIDIDKLISSMPEKGGADLYVLGLPDNSHTTFLKNEGILKRVRAEMKESRAGNRTKHIIWTKGNCFDEFAAYWQKNKSVFLPNQAANTELCHPIPA